MGMKKIIAIFLAVLLLSGCMTFEPPTTISMYGKDMYYPPKPLAVVQIYHNKPPGRYIEMGEVTVEGAYSLKSARNVLRQNAAALGGDAVYITNIFAYPDTKTSGHNISCLNGNDGAIDIEIINNQGDTSFNWLFPDNSTSNLKNISSLEAGNYFLTVTDNKGCEATISETLTEPSSALEIKKMEADTNIYGNAVTT